MAVILKRSTVFVLLAAGLLLICFGGITNFLNQGFLQEFTHQQFVYSATSAVYPYWIRNPTTITDRLYFFNWTNPSSLKEPGYKPKFEEIGPYVFEETFEKVNVSWNDNNGTVTYTKIRTWFFKEEESNGSMSDRITTIDAVPVMAAYKTRFWGPFSRRIISIALSALSGIHMTKTVGEMSHDGYKDPIIDYGSKVPVFRDIIPTDRFGYFYEMNGTSLNDGNFNIETGANGLDKLGMVNEWKFRNLTGFYDSPCQQVKGASGDFWPHNIKKTDYLTYFSTELCRYTTFKYNRTVTVHGVKGYRFEPLSDLYDNGTLNSENRCFCYGECIPLGVLNVSSCRWGAPAFASYPHFYDSDSSYKDAIEGMKPDHEKHALYFIVEPTYGVTLEAAARLQINIMVQSYPDISLYRDIPKRTFFPAFWMEQKASIPWLSALRLKMVLTAPTIVDISSIISIVIGMIFLLLYFISWMQLRSMTNISEIRKSHNNLTSVMEKEVVSPLIKQKLEIAPTLKELSS